MNLASAYIQKRKYAKANDAADIALKLSPGYPPAVNCKAIAFYLFGREGGVDTTDVALAMLRESAAKNPELADTLYNQAALESEREREAAAKDSWGAFLSKEPAGPYADVALRHLGRSDGMARTSPRSGAQPSPVKLGKPGKETLRQLRGAEKRSFSIGRTGIDIHEKKGLLALAINDSIEMVVVDVEKPFDVPELKQRHGEPLRTVRTTAGSTLVYEDRAFDVQNGEVIRITYFEGKNR